jgi:imidazolonepropionase-like amidohydrolase
MQAQIPLWKEAVRRGVKVAFGTDQSHRLLVGENLVELGFMTEWLGMTPMQALVAATARAAECVQRADIGALEAGKAADLLVVDGDPLAKIEDLEKTVATVRSGTVYDDAELWNAVSIRPATDARLTVVTSSAAR